MNALDALPNLGSLAAHIMLPLQCSDLKHGLASRRAFSITPMLFENRYSRDIETAAECSLFPTSHPFEANALLIVFTVRCHKSGSRKGISASEAFSRPTPKCIVRMSEFGAPSWLLWTPCLLFNQTCSHAHDKSPT